MDRNLSDTENMESRSDSAGGGGGDDDDEEICARDSGNGDQSCREFADFDPVSSDAPRSDECTPDPSDAQAIDRDFDGTVPEFANPTISSPTHVSPTLSSPTHVSPTLSSPTHVSPTLSSPTLGNSTSAFLPSDIAQEQPQFEVSSIFCPSMIAPILPFAQYGIRMSPYTTRHTGNVPMPIPCCLLDSFRPRHGLSNSANNGSKVTREAKLPDIPSGDSHLELCDSMQCEAAQNNIAEDDEKLLSQAEGGYDHEKAPLASSINPGGIDETESVEMVDPADPGPISLQESRSDDNFHATLEPSMFYPSTTYDTFSGSLTGHEFGRIGLSSAIATNENEVLGSVENINYNSNVQSSSIGQSIDSMQCASADPSSDPVHPSAKSDDIDWISCKICFKFKWKYVLLPCGHVLCGCCYRRILPSGLCPFCRTAIEDKVEGLLSYNFVHDPGK